MASDDTVQGGVISCIGEILVGGASLEPLAMPLNCSSRRENRMRYSWRVPTVY
jgi:hypothetical protein